VTWHEFVLGGTCVVLGYALGVATGVRFERQRLTREVVMEVREAQAWVRRRVTVWTVIAVLMLVIAAQGVMSARAHQEDQAGIRGLVMDLQRHDACLTAYANQLHDSLAPRQRASKRLQAADEAYNGALLALLTDAAHKAPQGKIRLDAKVLRQSARHKQDVAAQLNRERARRPYPSPPKDVCPK
jgi:hypothetical protein